MDSLRKLKTQWDRTAAAVLTLLGAVLLVIGYFGVSGEALVALQLPYIVSGGLGGIFLMGVGAALWLAAELRDEWHKLDRIESLLESRIDQLAVARDSDGAPILIDLTDIAPPGRSTKARGPLRARPAAESAVNGR